jgi:X-Pro dipeptidyl-peptidase
MTSSRSRAPFARALLLRSAFLCSALAPLVGSYAQEAAPAAPAEKSVPTFVNGEAQIVPAFQDRKTWIRHDLFVETEFDSDGDGRKDRMHVAVTRPQQTETEGLKVAVIYETSPYFAGTAPMSLDYFWSPKQELGAPPPMRKVTPSIPHQSLRPVLADSEVSTWVPRGFAVVHSSSPGTGLSEGCPTIGGDNESLAPKAVIDWLNGRAKGYTERTGGEEVVATWSTGKVGMIGTSFNGTLPLAAATTGVEGLEAIVPIAPNTSYYHYYRSNGLVRHPGGWMGEDIDVLYDFVHSGYPELRESCDCKVRDEELRKNFDRQHGDWNSFWAGRDYLLDLKPLRAATLMAHAFNDWNVMPEHSVRIYRAIRAQGVPAMAYFHQGGHGGHPPLTLINRWFSRYLYGVENGVEKDPRAWIVREGERKPTAYPEYPHPEAAPVTLHPSGSGNAIGALRAEPARSGEAQTLVDDVALAGAELAQAQESPHRLLFASEVLQEPVHLSGTARIRLRLASSAPAANLSVWLVQLPWDPKSRRIYDNVITRGWADPQNHSSLEKGEPLVPGQFYDLAFELQPDDQIVPKGKQIGLMIFSSDQEFTLWPPKGTELRVDLTQVALELPVVGGEKAFAKATAAR